MTQLFFHNSLTRRREAFVPADPHHVRMYVCGPTVYDLPHLGNIRSNVVFDVLARLLRHTFPRVTYVRNITDVDDKINARAAENHEPIEALTARTAADYHADMAAIGNLPPDIEPCATAHISEMIGLIERLIEAGHAYAADGHVLFSVRSFPQYGALSGRTPEDLLAGARVEVAPYKENPGDFVLWKPSGENLPGWESPWGRGRPGWHIECSAMSWRYLGENFDIQSMCAFPGSHFARYWLHNGMLQVNGEKMSKSLGNFFTLRDILARAPAEAIRLLILRTHYRAVLDFTEAALAEARQEIDRFYRALERTPAPSGDSVPEPILSALADDLNTPAAIAALRVLADAAMAGDPAAAGGLRAGAAMLGLLQLTPETWFRGTGDAAVEAAIAERLAARKARDFARADAIRQALVKEGIVLEDSANATTWRRIAPTKEPNN
jgi:cysteinyl-tRNA synthetase